MPQVQAASLLLSKQTRAHISSQLPVSQPCFLGNRVRWIEGTDVLPRANPLSSKVCLTSGHVTQVPMTTRLEGSLGIALIRGTYHTCQRATLKSRRECWHLFIEPQQSCYEIIFKEAASTSNWTPILEHGSGVCLQVWQRLQRHLTLEHQVQCQHTWAHLVKNLLF